MEERRTDTEQTFYREQEREREEWTYSVPLTEPQSRALRDLALRPSAENRARVEAIARRLEAKLAADDRTIRDVYPLSTTEPTAVPEETDDIWIRTLQRYGQVMRALDAVKAVAA